jgi:hypothetical protein
MTETESCLRNVVLLIKGRAMENVQNYDSYGNKNGRINISVERIRQMSYTESGDKCKRQKQRQLCSGMQENTKCG